MWGGKKKWRASLDKSDEAVPPISVQTVPVISVQVVPLFVEAKFRIIYQLLQNPGL
jgi:hypothetical protein